MAIRIPKKSQIRRSLQRGERVVDAQSRSVLRALNVAVREYSLRVQIELGEAFKDPTRLPRLAEVVDIGNQLAEALLDAGLEDTARLFRTNFRKVERAALDHFGEFGLPSTRAGIDVDSLDALAAFNEQQFLNLADRRLVAPIRDAVINGVVGGRERDIVLDEIMALIEAREILTRAGEEFTDYQIETLVNDSYRRHYRQTKAQKAEALGLEIVWFQGPDDEVTSAQCEFMLNSAPHGAVGMWMKNEFTMDNINALMAAAGVKARLRENPLSAGGHFGCRHTVSFIPLSLALEQGFVPPDGVDIADDDEVEANAEAA